MKRFAYIIFLLIGCKEVYNPPLKNPQISYLVVEGNIVAGNDSTFVRLTRTIPVSDSGIVYPERNATVKVEGEDGSNYSLQQDAGGFYYAPPLNISINTKYRLHIFTADGKEYASDFVEVKQTPPIDSVSWKSTAAGVTIYASAHDASAATQYYRWQYIATWEHRAKQNSILVYDASTQAVRNRLPEEQIYRCWNKDTSGEILLFSTAGLSSDIVFEKPLVFIPYASQQISTVYSIIVTQNALTKEGYEFWENIKKNNEEIGTIFDPQPFADFGNMHCTSDPAEPVMGFISACSLSKKRIYIRQTEVEWPFFFPSCKDTIVTPDKVAEVFSGVNYLPVLFELSPPGAVLGDFPECVDCRLAGGGTTVKPPYMP